MSYILYTAKATIGCASHIAIEESGLVYSAVALDFTQQQQASDQYLQINPKARVPSLVVEQGIITETPAILNYLAVCAPSSAIALPEGAYAQAQIQSFNSYLCSTVHVAHAHKLRGKRWVDDEASIQSMSANVPKTMALCFETIEQNMLQGPWVHGDAFSISDPYLYTISSWLESDGVDINRYPKVKAHHDLMAQRESVKTMNAFFR